MKEQLNIDFSNAFIRAGASGVQFFFVLSGFIMFLVHWRDIGRSDRAATFVKKRLVRVYPVFWLVLSIFLTAKLVLGQADDQLHGFSDVLRAYLLLPFEDHPPMAVAWTLSHELLFYALLCLAILTGRFGLSVLAFWWSVCLASFLWTVGSGQRPAFPVSFLISEQNLLFLMGMVAGFCNARLESRLAAALLAVGVVGYGAMIASGDLVSGALQPIGYGLSSALAVSGAVALERTGLLNIPRVLRFLGDASYSIYLGHSLVLLATTIGLRLTGLHPAPHILFALLLAGGILGGTLLYTFLERPLLNLMAQRQRAPAILLRN